MAKSICDLIALSGQNLRKYFISNCIWVKILMTVLLQWSSRLQFSWNIYFKTCFVDVGVFAELEPVGVAEFTYKGSECTGGLNTDCTFP